MYAITKKITDEQAEATILRTCNHENGAYVVSSGLFRPVIRPHSAIVPLKSHGRTTSSPSSAPACNLLVAAARKTVKSPDVEPSYASGSMCTTTSAR